MQSSYKKNDKIFLEQLGSRIRELRLENGLSQEKLSFGRAYEKNEERVAGINIKPGRKFLKIYNK